MPQASLNALVAAYRNQAEWLFAQAKELESGARRVIGLMRGKEVDLTANVAAEYLHKARNLIAIIEIYERLHVPAETKPQTASVSPIRVSQGGPQT